MESGVGFSEKVDSYLAGCEAAEAAIRDIGKPRVIFIVSTEYYDQNEVVNGALEVVGEVEVIGFSSGGVISPRGIIRRGVGILAISGENVEIATEKEEKISTDPYESGLRLGEKIMARGYRKGTVFLMPDGYASNISDLLSGLYEALGPEFRYVGGGTGDDLNFKKTYQFTADGIVSDGVVAGVIDGVNVGISIGHGWRPRGEIAAIGKTSGKRVYEINGKRAYLAYCDLIGEIPKEKFYRYTMKYPLGFSDAYGNFIIRDPLSVNDDLSVDFVTEVPSESVGFLMEGRKDELIEAASRVASEARSTVENPSFVFVFDCISRTVLLGERFEEELKVIVREVGEDVPLIGALTFGEVGCFTDIPFFHNKTLAIAVCGKD